MQQYQRRRIKDATAKTVHYYDLTQDVMKEKEYENHL
jgi:hypothetical protein